VAAAPKPPVVAELTWTGDLAFAATSRAASLTIDGHSKAGPSPVQLLVFALAGCMAADVVHILKTGRHPLRALHARLTALRAPDDPHRVVDVQLQFTIEGAVPLDAVEHAIALSRDKYCSVWHSMDQAIDFKVTLELAG
jgi:putative redox protein